MNNGTKQRKQSPATSPPTPPLIKEQEGGFHMLGAIAGFIAFCGWYYATFAVSGIFGQADVQVSVLDPVARLGTAAGFGIMVWYLIAKRMPEMERNHRAERKADREHYDKQFEEIRKELQKLKDVP